MILLEKLSDAIKCLHDLYNKCSDSSQENQVIININKLCDLRSNLANLHHQDYIEIDDDLIVNLNHLIELCKRTMDERLIAESIDKTTTIVNVIFKKLSRLAVNRIAEACQNDHLGFEVDSAGGVHFGGKGEGD